MKKNKEILDRVKLLMNYEMGKTLEENINSIEDDLIIEQVVPGLKGIFRIGGEELVAGLKNSMDDVVRFFREAGGVEIVGADGSITKAKNAGELIDALHSGRITAKTLGEVNSGLLRSIHTPENVIDNILSQKGFETKFNQVYGGLKNQPDEIVKILKKKGFPDSTIEKMMEKMKLGDSSVKTAASQAGLSTQQIDDIINNVVGNNIQLNQQSIETFLKDYSKKYGLKYSDAQISQISKDFANLIERELQKQGVNATTQNVMKSIERMTDKEIMALIDKVKMNVPPGFVQSTWTKFVDSIFNSSKKGGTSLAKSVGSGLWYIYKRGFVAAAIYQGLKYLANIETL